MPVLLGLPVRRQIAESFGVLREPKPQEVVGSRNNPMKLSIISIHPPQEEARRAYTSSCFAIGSLQAKKPRMTSPPQRRPPDGTGGNESIDLKLQLCYFRKYLSIS